MQNLWRNRDTFLQPVTKYLHQTSQMNHIGFKEVREESFHVFCLFACLLGFGIVAILFPVLAIQPRPLSYILRPWFLCLSLLFDTEFIHLRLASDLFCSWAWPWTSDLSFPINQVLGFQPYLVFGQCWGWSRVLRRVGKHSTNWATS